MKNLLYLLLLVLVNFSCEQKPSQIDKKLQQEETYFSQKSIISNRINIQKMFESIHNRGYKPEEKILSHHVIKYQKIFLRINEHIDNKDSLQTLFPLYEKQVQTIDSCFKEWGWDLKLDKNIIIKKYQQFLTSPSFQEKKLFKNQFQENHSYILNACFSFFGGNNFKFEDIIIYLKTKEYDHGDTIHGNLFIANHPPLLPTIYINGKIVNSNDYYKYSHIIDSTQKASLDIDVFYFKTMKKDTNFNVQVNYQLK